MVVEVEEELRVQHSHKHVVVSFDDAFDGT